MGQIFDAIQKCLKNSSLYYKYFLSFFQKGDLHNSFGLVMRRMWFLRIFGFGCEITKSADSDIDKSSHEEFSVNKNVGFPAVLHGFQLSKH